MIGIKKHTPVQSEDNTILDQIPDDKMDEFIRGLLELAQKKKAKNRRTQDQ